MVLLWSEAHAEAGQVSIAEGEEDNEDDVPGVVGEQHGQVVPGLDITQHKERHKDHTETHHDGQDDAVLTGLTGKRDIVHQHIVQMSTHRTDPLQSYTVYPV